MRLLTLRASLLATAAALCTQPAQAQDAATVVLPTVNVEGQQPANSGYQPLNTTLGAGTSTPILDIPQSVAVVPREALRDQQARSLDDALANVSGIAQANNLGGTQDAFLRRGFGDNRDGSIMLDGLRTVLPRSFNSTTDYVEVLKGPSSALYGILDPGGMVNVVTLKPELEQHGSLQLRGTSFVGGSGGFDVTGPIGGSGFAYRLNGDYQNEQYWRNYGSIHRRQISPSVAWNGQDTTVQATYWHEDYAVPFDRGTIFDPVTGKAVPVKRSERFDERYNVSRGYTDYATLRLNQRLGQDWNFSAGYAYSLNNYADQNARVVSYNRNTGVLTRRADATEDSTMFSHAFRADLSGEVSLFGIRHDLLFGTSYDYASTRRTELVRGTNRAGFNIYNPVYDLLAPPGRIGARDDSDQTERLITESFYLQDAIHLTDQWILVGGLRYQHFDQIAGKGRPFNLNTDVNADRLVPRVGLVYKLRPDVSLYATYSESFKPNSSIANSYGSQPPETGRSYEVGAKLDLLDGLTATVAAYNIVKQNVLYRYEIGGVSFNATAGEVRSRGVELDLAGRITPQLSVIGSYAFTDAKVTDDPEIKGNRPALVPKHTASMFLTYDFGEALGSEGLRAGAGARAMSAREGDRANSFSLPSYAVVDAFVSYDTRIDRTPLRLQVNVKNLLDKSYYTSTIGSNLGVAVGEPLQVVASATVRF